MRRSIPSLRPRELVRIIKNGGCGFYRQGKGDHEIYIRIFREGRRIVPIDMGASELSPPYVLRILRQFGFTDEEIDELLA
jgi:predicted RNA binding protein YcfA (HicA-like mRNA interferase family)